MKHFCTTPTPILQMRKTSSNPIKYLTFLHTWQRTLQGAGSCCRLGAKCCDRQKAREKMRLFSDTPLAPKMKAFWKREVKMSLLTCTSIIFVSPITVLNVINYAILRQLQRRGLSWTATSTSLPLLHGLHSLHSSLLSTACSVLPRGQAPP